MVTSKYGGGHKAIRRATLHTAYGRPCARCGRPMLVGQPLDLDHDDLHGGYVGWSHARCNRAEGAARGNRQRTPNTRRTIPAMSDYAIGIDIAYNRQFTTIAAAGRTKGFVSVRVLERLPGSSTAGAVIACIRQHERHLIAAVIDPKSPALTLLPPLRDEQLSMLYEMTTQDCIEAHHLFLDEFYAGRVKHDRDASLAKAMQFADVRHLGGGEAIDRRGAQVDVSPLTAAQMALFGLLRYKPAPLPAIY